MDELRLIFLAAAASGAAGLSAKLYARMRKGGKTISRKNSAIVFFHSAIMGAGLSSILVSAGQVSPYRIVGVCILAAATGRALTSIYIKVASSTARELQTLEQANDEET